MGAGKSTISLNRPPGLNESKAQFGASSYEGCINTEPFKSQRSVRFLLPIDEEETGEQEINEPLKNCLLSPIKKSCRTWNNTETSPRILKLNIIKGQKLPKALQTNPCSVNNSPTNSGFLSPQTNKTTFSWKNDSLINMSCTESKKALMKVLKLNNCSRKIIKEKETESQNNGIFEATPYQSPRNIEEGIIDREGIAKQISELESKKRERQNLSKLKTLTVRMSRNSPDAPQTFKIRKGLNKQLSAKQINSPSISQEVSPKNNNTPDSSGIFKIDSRNKALNAKLINSVKIVKKRTALNIVSRRIKFQDIDI
ncbi:unnamed protein product [Blepharisma stoltei]|uniref:Uncharacterized protein n=1 Tax=Blepharisma stoltei TaxID=1481888 RepID=A0AAU9IRJ9_9CILI|nr:unnamed protein product [Blepharisma stoltei]